MGLFVCGGCGHVKGGWVGVCKRPRTLCLVDVDNCVHRQLNGHVALDTAGAVAQFCATASDEYVLGREGREGWGKKI